MAKTWIVDLWIKDTTVTLPDGSTTKISPTREQLRSMKSLPEHFRTSRFMQGRRWRVTWHEDTPDGQKARSKSFDSKNEAEEFSAELEDDIRMSRYINPAARERPFSEVAEEWLKSKKVKPSTLLRYREALDDYVLPQWGSMRIGRITRTAIDTWVSELSAGTATTGFSRRLKKRKLAPSYVGHLVRVAFGSVMRYAVATRVISINPLTEVEVPKSEATDVEDLPVLSPAEVEEFAAAARLVRDAEADEVLTQFLAYCGPRVNEALALEVQDINLDTLRARIRQTWSRSGNSVWELGPTKTWQRRTIPIPRFLVPGLRCLMKGRAPSDPLFHVNGEPITYRFWYDKIWRKLAADAGLAAGFKIHDLRHTAASLAIAAGADVKLVQRMLGHRDATETLNTYAHLWPDRMDEVMGALTEQRARDLMREIDGDDERRREAT